MSFQLGVLFGAVLIVLFHTSDGLVGHIWTVIFVLSYIALSQFTASAPIIGFGAVGFIGMLLGMSLAWQIGSKIESFLKRDDTPLLLAYLYDDTE